jgi:teichuronic acid biosynthesis glycosyltransferase TuaG
MTDLRYSIIIPAYNASATLRESVESCLSQTYPPYEVIVIDDGSTDNTVALLNMYFGDKVKVLSLPQNAGPAAARNKGLSAASGTHIVFQDADDKWHAEKLQHVSEVLKGNPHIRFLFHPYTLSVVDFPVEQARVKPQVYPFWKLLLSNPIGTPCVVIAKDAVQPFKESLRYMEDYELFLRIAEKHGVWRIPQPFTQIGRPILSKGGQSSSRWKMRIGEMQAWWAFATAKPLYFLALPFLVLLSLVKHSVKALLPVRKNY